MLMNIWKIIYLNCVETFEDMIDHQSYADNLSSCEIKIFRPERDLNTWPLRYWCSALTTELSSHLGAGHIVICIIHLLHVYYELTMWSACHLLRLLCTEIFITQLLVSMSKLDWQYVFNFGKYWAYRRYPLSPLFSSACSGFISTYN